MQTQDTLETIVNRSFYCQGSCPVEMLEVKVQRYTKGLFCIAEKKVGKLPNLSGVYLNNRSDLSTAEC